MRNSHRHSSQLVQEVVTISVMDAKKAVDATAGACCVVVEAVVGWEDGVPGC